MAELNLRTVQFPYYGVKEAVFPFNMFPEVDPTLGPEMKSTGEVLGMADSFGLAFFKSQEAAGQRLPTEGTVLISVTARDREDILEVARFLKGAGFNIVATEGTQRYLEENGVSATFIKKVHEGRPNIVDAIHNKEIQLIINTPIGKDGKYDDSYIRKTAIKYKLPYITTGAAAKAAAEGIKAYLENRDGMSVRSLQDYHKDIS
jgi:carbamoyl-phosphate synthase large subunit